MTLRTWGLIATLALLGGCASHDAQRVEAPSAANQTTAPVSPAAGTSGGRYAMSGDAYPLEPPDVSKVPDARPRVEAPSRAGNRSSYEVWGKTYHVLPDATGYEKQGNASWYGEKFHGYATSNGEIYDMYEMSAAHRSLPLPTFARVTSLDNGRSVIVRVNDRGPFHSDREIDLSYAAAARLGFLDNGTGRVKVEAINPVQWLAQQANGEAPAKAPTPAQPAGEMTASPSSSDAPSAVYLQIAALGNPEGAQTLQQRLEGAQPHAVRIVSDSDIYRVQVGPFNPGQEAKARETLRQAGFPQAFVVR
ncbi:septal ring lytic transglycosylase RlpA family protein [Halovibrio sp. HP20-50]|uniref:septal ring lytic transglycosylase RlpA family protein n=1 Tax=Halovibrio sp. HP20-59 TaxID=3080275 RepID=UPI00294ADC95|nr:septal ring lytic transglycosylase RlpA family protein [Halovibrio sp. HP20-59]MEA2119316.1 septal ring lytic transglycosylase RlpA family protein [Halovibrio sp. HP20-59]